MADVTKEKVINIKTQGAEKNVKTLKQQIKELREQMALLEKGTESYDKASQKLANLSQKQIEISEAMKYSNRDLGQTLSNLTSVASGVVGAISSVNGVMSLMGADSEEAQKAMVRIQSLMAIIQGMGAIDTAIKALKGLTVAFKDFNVVRGANAGVVAGAATAELGEAGALAENTVKMHKNNEEAKEFNRLNEEGAEATKKSTEEIDKETTSILARTEAQRGNIEAAKKYREELEKLNSKKEQINTNARNATEQSLQKLIDESESALSGKSKGIVSYRLDEYKKLLKGYKDGIIDEATALNGAFDKLSDDFLDAFDKMGEVPTEIAGMMEAVAMAMSPEDINKRILETKKDLEDYKQSINELFDGENIENSEMLQQMLEDQTVGYEKQIEVLQKVQLQQTQLQESEIKLQEEYQKQIEATIAAENTETSSINANTAAKEANSKATEDVTKQEGKMGAAAKKSDPLLRKAFSGIVNGVKSAAKAVKAFIVGNPILAIILAAVTAIGAAIGAWANSYAKAREKAAEVAKMNNEINMELKKQQTDMTALLRMFYAQNTTQKEKEVLAKEINKLAKEELVTRNEITGQWELSNVKLLEYNKNLRTSIELEYHKKAILESMEKEEEARNNAIHERNHLIGNLFRTENGYLKDANEELAKQEEHWKAIEKLTAGTVKNIERENKSSNTVKTTVGGIKKTFQELYKEISELYKRLYNNIANAAELRKVFNGIYTEASVAFDKIVDAINGNRFASKISDGFKTALKNGLKDIKATDISLDMIFGDAFNELESKLNSEKGKLKSMLTSPRIDEKELTKQKTYVDELEKELKTMSDIANAVLKYKQAVESTREAQEARNRANEHYNKELEITMRYMQNQRRENGRDFQYADLEREIELNTQLRNETNQRLKEEKARLDELQNSNLKNKETIEEIADLQKRIDEDEKTANEAKLNISNAKWQKRLAQLDEEYELIKRNSEEEQQALEIDRREKGGGVVDYNTDRDLIEMQMQAMVEYANRIDEFYAERQAQYEEGSEQWLLLENERLAAQEQLQAEYREKELEADKVHADRRLNIQKTYIAAYQALSSQLSGILGEVMNMYDENSKEYLNLRYAQGVTDTISGTISAYMSGIQSGLVPPYNQILAAAMAASTFAMGVAQLANMKKGTLANANAKPVEIGREYDTLSYQMDVDTLSAIRDQRCYVLESDISDTQRRVQVQESSATF